MPFAEEFISGYMQGQQIRQNRANEERSARRFEFEQSNQKIEEEVLKHRLKALKIEQQIQARDAALKNLETLEGADEEDLGPDQFEGGVLPAAANPVSAIVPGMSAPSMSGGLNSIVNKMKGVEIPGIEELGVPGVTRRPRSLQQRLADAIAQKRQMEEATPRELSPGERLVSGAGGLLAENPNENNAPVKVSERLSDGTVVDKWVTREEALKMTATKAPEQGLVKISERAPDGTVIDKWVTREEARGITAVKSPLPRRTGSLSSGSDIDDVVDGIVSGLDSPDIAGLKGDDALKIRSALSARGFNRRAALNEQRAVQTAISTMNSADRANLMIASEATGMAIIDLRRLVNPKEGEAGWNPEWGKITWPNIAKIKAFGSSEQKEVVAEIESTIEAVREGVAAIRAAGNQPNNRTLDEAAEILSPGYTKDDLLKRIERLSTNIGYRVAAIKGYQPIMPAAAGRPNTGAPVPTTSNNVPQKTDDEVRMALQKRGMKSDPATVAAVKGSARAMAELFGQ